MLLGCVEPSRTLSSTSIRIGSPMLPIIERRGPGLRVRDHSLELYHVWSRKSSPRFGTVVLLPPGPAGDRGRHSEAAFVDFCEAICRRALTPTPASGLVCDASAPAMKRRQAQLMHGPRSIGRRFATEYPARLRRPWSHSETMALRGCFPLASVYLDDGNKVARSGISTSVGGSIGGCTGRISARAGVLRDRCEHVGGQ